VVEKAPDSAVEQLIERCEMCGERLGWAGLHRSRCLRGHILGMLTRSGGVVLVQG
jgi:hypothetical protein